jgi:hypothetical protein
VADGFRSRPRACRSADDVQSAKEGKRNEALAALREALEHGLDLETALGLAKDADFNTLHGDPRFEILVTKAKPRRVHRTERSIRALATSPTWTVLRAAPPSGRTRAAEGIRTLPQGKQTPGVPTTSRGNPTEPLPSTPFLSVAVHSFTSVSAPVSDDTRTTDYCNRVPPMRSTG